jgi:hypothetical protein
MRRASGTRSGARRGALCALALLASCEKVPLLDINASFPLADAAWFEQEQTLFVFYNVTAQQALGAQSQLELTYRTDALVVPWTPIADLPLVHTHVPAVNCGERAQCGSLSLTVRSVPRDVGLRLRYHRDGQVFLHAPVNLNVIGTGPAHTNRSLIVYGVLNASNTQVQWRARHQFPTLRNQQVEELGLRRSFVISDRAHGAVSASFAGNPYGYGFAPSCPTDLTPLSVGPIQTSERAIFDEAQLPVEAGASAGVCARSTVTDSTGTFEAVAVARKNPDVRSAFPALRSPVKPNTPIRFLLRICGREISEQHRLMQLQRVMISEPWEELCVDDWKATGFATQLGSQLSARVDQVRAAGNDMVLMISLHHDEPTGQLARVVEAALAEFLPSERDQSSPRLSGAFVFDSYGHSISRLELANTTLWCPPKSTFIDLDDIPIAPEACPIQPDIPDLELGAFRVSTLPILPNRAQYLRFVEKYSEAQAGRMTGLSVKAPERTPLSQNVSEGLTGFATFFNNEVVTAAATDVFSYCAPNLSDSDTSDDFAEDARFRSAAFPEPPTALALLPEFHAAMPEPSYPLGISWKYPFLLHMEYETFAAGAATVFSFTVPFGIGVPGQEDRGARLWAAEVINLANILKQCTRFCDHPTFGPRDPLVGPVGVYNVQEPFDPRYRNDCYNPKPPEPGQGGFPVDP